jgi:hypothetical protein
MAQYYVTPVNENESARWEKIYGRTHLPVKYRHPHQACTQRWGDVLVYYLDGTAVPDALLDRLATFEARRLGILYTEARMIVRREWLIQAAGCQVETAVNPGNKPWQPAFSFIPQVPISGSTPKLHSVTL